MTAAAVETTHCVSPIARRASAQEYSSVGKKSRSPRNETSTLSQYSLEAEPEILLRVAHDLGIRLVVQEHLENARALGGLVERTLVERPVGHGSKTSPGR